MLISSWMEESGVAFGTSGARGLVTAMTDRLCFAYVTGYLQWMHEVGAFSPGMEVALAGDLRPSSPRILRACMKAVRKAGGRPLYCGFVPTPCLSLAAFRKKIPSLMVTGSHIPADRNGIKFNRENQEFSKEDEAGMRRQHVSLPTELFNHSGDLITTPELPPSTDVVSRFLARYRDFFGDNALKDMVVGVYQHSSVARDLMVDLIEALGGRAVPFGRKATFHPIDTEALTPEDTTLLRDWASRHQVSAIISSDGDADRPLLTDHHGNMIRGDIMGLVTARLLKAAFVATPVTSNTGLEMSQFVHRIARTKIGSPYVLAAMPDPAHMPEGAIIGYEANGGLILGQRLINGQHVLDALPTRDFALPLIATLISARDCNDDLTRLIEALPRRVTASTCLKDTPWDRGLALVAHFKACAKTDAFRAALGIPGRLDHIDETDGTRLFFTSGVILHIRPSGNAPELRLYVEANAQAEADRLLKAAEAYILSR